MIRKCEVIIIGAGPCGLLLGNLLAAREIPVIILEKDRKRLSGSRAIGVTPVSLSILEKLRLADVFARQGVPVHNVQVFGTSCKLGEVGFSSLPQPYAYILALPQMQTEWLLEENLKRYACAVLLRGREVYEITGEPDTGKGSTEVRARVCPEPGRATWTEEIYAGRIICGCDGLRSRLRELLHIPFKGGYYPETFVMGDYQAEHKYDQDAYLYFTRYGSVESFPLPDVRRRWIAQTPCLLKEGLASYLEHAVASRTGVRIDPGGLISSSVFQPQRFIAAVFFKGNFVLCGDAAHTMSPIGGQGMNTGFGDADWLAQIIGYYRQHEPDISLQELFSVYERLRKRAVWVTANRAWFSMRVGTLKGRLISAFRNCLITGCLHLPVAKQIPGYFAGYTNPYKRAGFR